THLDQRPLRPPKGAFARFHGCSNDNIGGRGRLRRPEIVLQKAQISVVNRQFIAGGKIYRQCSAVSTTPLINFWAVSTTLANIESCQY
ncbi:MAG: hypothetical protein ACK53Y_09110, partial [bacterium]